MTATALYILKATFCSGILFGYYWLFLRNKSFHSFNRFYLLFTVALSLCLPIIKVDFWQTQNIPSSNVIQLLQAVTGNGEQDGEIVAVAKNNSWDLQQWILLGYVCISSILLIAFIRSIFIIVKMAIQHPVQKMDDILLVDTTAKNTPFSFFRFVFWNNSIDINSTNGQQILQHEITHVKGKHSYDKLFMNILLIILWCNPFFWLIKKELGMLHEFIADKKAVADNEVSTFAAMILQTAYPQHNFQLANNFFHSPIKRRLIMLTKNNTHISYFSRILALPLLLLVFAAFTFKQQVKKIAVYEGKKITVVIDAGHGGNDLGGRNENGSYEKDITLAIAKKIKELNSNSNINIVLTRETDIYQSPSEKANLINKAGAGLAIVIHIDATTKDSVEIKNGMSVWVSKDIYANSLQSKIAASAIIQSFLGNYPLDVIPQPMQRLIGIKVLQESKCPAVLIEAGYITNNKDLAFLQSGKGQETIANNVLKGIEKYLTATIKTENNRNTGSLIEQKNKLQTNPDEVDDRALLVVNNKKIGSLKNADALITNLNAQISNFSFSAEIQLLKPAAALVKYGEDGKFGAYEVNKMQSKAMVTL